MLTFNLNNLFISFLDQVQLTLNKLNNEGNKSRGSEDASRHFLMPSNSSQKFRKE